MECVPREEKPSERFVAAMRKIMMEDESLFIAITQAWARA
jgi:hypothetical protein